MTGVDIPSSSSTILLFPSRSVPLASSSWIDNLFVFGLFRLGGNSSNIESSGALWDRMLPVAPDLNESKTVSLWKSMSSSSPEVNPLPSVSEPTSVEARSAISDVRGGFELTVPKYDGEVGEISPGDDTTDVDMV